MPREMLFPFAAIAFALAAPAAPAGADVYDDLVKYEWAQGRTVPAGIEAEVRQADTPAARRAVEAGLLKALADPQATYECKQLVCRMLARAGSSACVPAVAKLLGDPKLSHMARFALQHLPAPEAGAALRQALGTLDGALRIGVIASLGERRDGQAVAALAKLLSAEEQAAAAAIGALGRIASAAAAEALAAARVPDALRGRWADAYLLCADRMLADGKAAEAAGVYRRMSAKGNPKFIRVAALRGVVMADQARATDTLLALLTDADADLSGAAGKFIVEVPGEAATKAFAAALSSMKGPARIALIDALTARADVAAAPAVAQLAAADDETLRIAAIQALAVLGDASCVPMLVKAASAGGPVGGAATDTLNRLRGAGVGEAMAKLLDSPDPAFRAGIVGVLAARADTTMVPAMLKAARDKDANVRKAAVTGLAAVAGGKELGELVELFLAAKGDSERVGLERAVSAAAMRTDDLDDRSAPVVAALAKADAPSRATLVSLLGRFGGEKALEAVRGQLKSPDASVATEAVRALAAWPDDAPAADLLGIIKAADDRVRKVLAFRGYVRMANMPAQRSAAETTAMYRQALALATTPAEKKSVLAGLAGAHSADALKLVEGLLDDPALKAEAELACVQVAGNARGAAPDEARAALKRLSASTKNDAVRKRAQETLNEMDKFRGYVTSWLLSGPYTTGDAFSTAFPPEKPGGKGAQWQTLSKGVGPQIIDLNAALGGENRAAYLKTNVWSPADQPVRLEIGSDDGVKVWVSGKQVHANNASRPVNPGEDKAAATLRKGWNALLVKVAQGGGDWGFCLRICRPDGAALDGLRVSLEGK